MQSLACDARTVGQEGPWEITGVPSHLGRSRLPSSSSCGEGPRNGRIANGIVRSGRGEILDPAKDDRISVILDDQLHTCGPAVTLTNLFRDDEL